MVCRRFGGAWPVLAVGAAVSACASGGDGREGDDTASGAFGAAMGSSPDGGAGFDAPADAPGPDYGEAAVFAWQMQGPDPAKDVYTQTGDYSFDLSKAVLTSWDHVVLLQNGAVAWGTPP